MKIEPLWQRVPKIFAYGLQPVALMLIVGLSLFPMLGWLISASFWFWLITLAVAYRYCFSVLEHTAEGDLKAPPLNMDTLVYRYEVPFKQIWIIIFFMLAAVSVETTLGSMAGLTFYYVGLFLFPASIMVMGTTHSFLEAINPVVLMNMVLKIGWSYLALYGMLFVLSIAESNVLSLFDAGYFNVLAYFLKGISLYFSILTFHMMGYLLYQFHEELGITPTLAEKEEDGEDWASPLFESLMADGNTAGAIAELETIVAGDPNNLKLRKRLHTLLMTTDDRKKRGVQGRQYITRLLNEGYADEAANIFMDCTTKQDACLLEQEDQYLLLAEALRKKGKSEEVLSLLRAFVKRFQRSAQIPPLYLLAAKVLAEDLGQDRKAKDTLSMAIKEFPQHPMIEALKSYLGVIDEIARK